MLIFCSICTLLTILLFAVQAWTIRKYMSNPVNSRLLFFIATTFPVLSVFSAMFRELLKQSSRSPPSSVSPECSALARSTSCAPLSLRKQIYLQCTSVADLKGRGKGEPCRMKTYIRHCSNVCSQLAPKEPWIPATSASLFSPSFGWFASFSAATKVWLSRGDGKSLRW